jgi:hypothetical protein
VTPVLAQPAVAAGAGFVLGFLGGAGHLLLTRWRASLVTRRGALAVALSFPLAVAAPAFAVLAAARLSPWAAWVSPAGILVARVLLLRRLGGA